MLERSAWPRDGGEMGALIRDHDWSATPLGPVTDWPPELRTLVDLMLGQDLPMVLLWGADLRQIYNNGYCKLMGAKHPAGLGQPTRECWPEVWHINAPIYERVQGGETVTLTDQLFPVIREGAHEDAWFSLSYGPARTLEGAVTGVFITVVETTERVRHEASEARFRKMADAVPQILWFTDADGRVEFFNKPWFDYTGLSPLLSSADEVAAAALHPEDATNVVEAFAAARAAGTTFEHEHRIRSKTGEYRWFLARAEPYRDSGSDRATHWVGASLDIHDRRVVEDALLESEQQFRLIVENASDYAIFTTDSDRCIETWLPGAQKVFGWTADEVVGQRLDLTFTDEDQAEGVPAREQEEARAKGTAPDVRWHKRKDGSRVFIDGVNTVVRGSDGQVRGFLKIGQDVTERRLTQERLTQSEERFRQFAEASSDVLWISEADTGQLEYLSPAYEDIWGEPRDAVMSDISRWNAHLHPDDAVTAAEGLAHLRRGERYQAEYRIVRSDGKTRFIHDAGFPIIQDGQVVRLAGVAKDLTERRLVERALAESEERLRTLVEGLPQLVWRAVDRGHWTWASPQWTRFTGQSDAISRGMGWLDMVHCDDRQRAMDAWAQAEAAGGFEVDYRVRCEGGDYRWFHTRASPVHDASGAVIEWLGTSNDVDELLRLQRHQRVLLAELQHRVRNTLGVVRSIVRRTAGTAEDVEEMSAHLQGRLAAFSRVQAALTRAAEAGVDLASIVEDELLAHAAREGDSLTVRGPEVMLDPRVAEALSLAVHELTSNAVKYGALSSPEGRLSVRWSLAQRDGRTWLDFEWKELGVTLPRQEPSRRGFGLELLERTLPYEHDAVTSARFAPTGFHFTLAMPLRSATTRH